MVPLSILGWHTSGQSHRTIIPCPGRSASGAKATRRFSSTQTVICWSYNHSSLHTLGVQKQASGTWCRWLALSFLALPRAHEMPVSYSWISHSLPRAVKDDIRSLTYIGWNSCSGVTEGLDGGNKAGEKHSSEHMPAAQPAQGNVWSLREEWREEITTRTKGVHPNGFACAAGCNSDILWAFEFCLWIHRTQKSLDLPGAARGYSNKSRTIPEHTSSSCMVLMGGHSPQSRFVCALSCSLINTFDITSTLGINLQCSRELSTFETCQNSTGQLIYHKFCQ